jgi:hypothetical protein
MADTIGQPRAIITSISSLPASGVQAEESLYAGMMPVLDGSVLNRDEAVN